MRCTGAGRSRERACGGGEGRLERDRAGTRAGPAKGNPLNAAPFPAALRDRTEARPSDFAARFVRARHGMGHRASRARHRWRLASLALGPLLVVALATPGQWDIGRAAARPAPVLPMPFERPGTSFPGSAFYYLDTGESARPEVAGAATARDDAGDPAPGAFAASARPLAILAGRGIGTGLDRARALQCLTTAIYYEAASEPEAGQRAVAQVVLNRVAHPAYPATVCGVVFEGSERPTGCQFSFTCDGSMARRPMPLFWDRARKVASAALSGYVYAPAGLATHYHTVQVHPAWADGLNYLGTIGAHRFYSFRGRAGGEGAFRFAWAGGEPVAAAHPRDPSSATQAAAASLDPLLLQKRFDGIGLGTAPVTAPAAATASEALRAPDHLPEAHGIRPEYANSGRWIASPAS